MTRIGFFRSFSTCCQRRRHPAPARRQEREEIAAAKVAVAELEHGAARARIGGADEIVRRERHGDVGAALPALAARKWRTISGESSAWSPVVTSTGTSRSRRRERGGGAGARRSLRRDPADVAAPTIARRSGELSSVPAAGPHSRMSFDARALLQRAHDAHDHRRSADGRQALGGHAGRDRHGVVPAAIAGEHDGVEPHRCPPGRRGLDRLSGHRARRS